MSFIEWSFVLFVWLGDTLTCLVPLISCQRELFPFSDVGHSDMFEEPRELAGFDRIQWGRRPSLQTSIHINLSSNVMGSEAHVCLSGS